MHIATIDLNGMVIKVYLDEEDGWDVKIHSSDSVYVAVNDLSLHSN